MSGLLACALLAGCASYVPRPLHPRRAAAALQARSLSDPRLLRFLAVEQHRSAAPRWNLATLSLVALYERPDLPLAQARLREARGGEITASELPNPTLSIAPTYDATTGGWKVGPLIDFLIQPYGARRARIARARARIDEARQRIAIAAWSLRGQVRGALLELWSARAALRLAARRAALAGRYRDTVAQRYRAGMVSATALSTATLAGQRAALQRSAARRDLRLARSALASALGLPDAALDGLRLDLRGVSHPRAPARLQALVRAALVSRPEVLQALAHYASAQAALRLAVARQYPWLEIGPGYHYDQGDHKFIVSISLPLPVLNQNQGPIAQARAARQLAAAEFAAAQARVLAQIDAARADWQASQSELASARRLRGAAARQLRRQRARYAAGAIGRLRLLAAELACVQARQGTLAASLDQRRALGRLEAALYHPFLVARRSR